MALELPTVQQIRDRILADFESRLQGGPYSAGTFEYVLATALAGVAVMLHAAIGIASRNILPDRADSSAMKRWASIFGLAQKAATFHSGSATFAATAGSSIPASTTLRLRDGTQFTTSALASEYGGFITVAFTAVVAGSAGAASTGAQILLGSPISGVTSVGTVLSPGIAGGADAETNAALLERLLDRIGAPIRGGNATDYEAWIRETAGVDVLNVYVYGPERLGPGTVAASFSVDAVDVIPTSLQVAAVQAHVDSKRPIDMRSFTAFAPIAQPLSVTLKLAPNTPSVQAAVKAAVADLVRREATPGGTLLISHLREAISAAVGETDHELVTPTANVAASSQDHLITFRSDTGTISFLSF